MGIDMNYERHRAAREQVALNEDENAERLKIEFACALDEALKSSGKTREDLARHFNFSSARVENLLRGDVDVSVSLMSDIATWLGMRIEIKFVE